MSTLWKSVLLTIVCSFFSPLSEAASGQAVELGVKETSLGKLSTREISVSPDARRAAFTSRRGTGYVVVVDGKVWDKRYAGVSKPIFSPDGKRVACVVADKDGQRVVMDGVEADKLYPSISNLWLAPDGRLVFVAVDKVARKWWYVIGDWESDKIGGPFLANRDYSLIFSPNGKHFAYVNRSSIKEFTVVLDGQEVHRFKGDGHSKLEFTADGRLVYAIRSLFYSGNFCTIVSHAEGKKLSYGEKEDGLQFRGLDDFHISPDGGRIAAFARRGKKQQLVVWNARTLEIQAAVDVDPRDWRNYDFRGSKFTFSPDGARFGLITVIPDKGKVPASWDRRLVVDGKELTSDGRVWNFAFSPDGKHVAHTGDPGRKPQLFIDGRAVEKTADQVDDESRIFFSPDGKHTVVTAGKGYGKKRLFFDGDKGPDFDKISKQSICFSPDGARFAFVARDGGDEFVVVDGVPGKKYRGAILPRLRFSPDGKHLAYQVTRGRKWLIVVDGVESREEYDSFPSLRDLVFDGCDALHTIAERDGQYFRVEVSIKPK